MLHTAQTAAKQQIPSLGRLLDRIGVISDISFNIFIIAHYIIYYIRALPCLDIDRCILYAILRLFLYFRAATGHH